MSGTHGNWTSLSRCKHANVTSFLTASTMGEPMDWNWFLRKEAFQAFDNMVTKKRASK